MQRFLVSAVVISLATSGYLAFVAWNHLALIQDLESSNNRLSTEVETLEGSIEIQERELRSLQDRPAVNVQALAQTLSTLQGDVEAAESRIDSVSFRLDDVEYQLERPPGCFSGDPVYWASGFGGGLTC